MGRREEEVEGGRRHLRTPSSVPTGKLLLWSRWHRIASSAHIPLLMLGWVLNWKAGFLECCTCTLTNDASASLISILSSPLTSRDSTPPSLLRRTDTFSSTLSTTASVETAALRGPSALAAGAVAGAAMPMRASSASSAFSTSVDCFVLLPSCMPLPLGGAFFCCGGGASGCPSASNTRTGFRSSSWNALCMLDPIPPMPPSPALARCALFWSMAEAFFFASSFASLILLCRIMLCSFSSWLSISSAVFTCVRLIVSRCPMASTSSNASMISNAWSFTVSSSRFGANSGTSRASSRSVSRSSMMLDDLLVTRSR
mmetsp:Transcript_25640/g.51342  ORF Transcript_25640/g.51342 Transcript_25640/m.51342 type:complete len:314 (+) Transcript_25640:462-1403(+)